MAICNKCANGPQEFVTECGKILCGRCYILHFGCEICESKGYGFKARMGIVQMSKVYKLKITIPNKVDK